MPRASAAVASSAWPRASPARRSQERSHHSVQNANASASRWSAASCARLHRASVWRLSHRAGNIEKADPAVKEGGHGDLVGRVHGRRRGATAPQGFAGQADGGKALRISAIFIHKPLNLRSLREIHSRDEHLQNRPAAALGSMHGDAEFMPIDALSKMNVLEKQALWAYLRTLPPTPYGQR